MWEQLGRWIGESDEKNLTPEELNACAFARKWSWLAYTFLLAAFIGGYLDFRSTTQLPAAAGVLLHSSLFQHIIIKPLALIGGGGWIVVALMMQGRTTKAGAPFILALKAFTSAMYTHWMLPFIAIVAVSELVLFLLRLLQ